MAKPGSSYFADVDSLLRPAESQPAIDLKRLVVLAVALGAAYGFFMGWFAVALHWGTGQLAGYLQLISGTIKLPALFLGTLLVTFPSLYVFSALAGVNLDLLATLRLLVSAIVVNLAVAASLGTILAFFTLSTTSYPFIVVLNVVLLSVAGVMGLGYLRRTLVQVVQLPVAPAPTLPVVASEGEAPPVAPPPAASEPSAVPIFRVWTIIYALVGMQMGWLLRPFIGHPEAGFELFRARTGNFFLGLLDNLRQMFGS